MKKNSLIVMVFSCIAYTSPMICNGMELDKVDIQTGNIKPVLEKYLGSENMSKTVSDDDLEKLTGTKEFKKCQLMVDENWRDVVRRGQSISWKGSAAFSNLKQLYNSNDKDIATKEKAALKKDLEKINECAIVFATIKENLDDDENAKEEGAKSHNVCLGALGQTAQSNNQQNAQAAAMAQLAASQSGCQITCKTNGFQTVDYPACEKLVTAFNAFMVAEEVGKTAQQIDYLNTTTSEQTKAMANINDYTATLKAAKASYEKQAEIQKTGSAFQFGKLGVIGAMYANFPKAEDYLKKCNDNYKNMINDSILINLEEKAGSKGKIFHSSDGYNNANKTYYTVANKYNLFLNQETRDQVRHALIKTGVEAVKLAGMGIVLDNQADMVGKAIKNVNSYTPQQLIPDDMILQKCIADPSLPECAIANNAEGSQDLMGNTIYFDNLGTNTTNDNTVTDSTPSSSTNSNTNGEKAISDIKIGDLDSVAKSAGGITPGTIAGELSQTSPASGGGGGGPGGAPSTSAADVGGGGGSGGGSYGSKSYGYDGGLGFAGGGKGLASTSRSKDSSNPFSDMFGKGANAKGGTMNFRDLASIGSKNTQIWDMLSKQYKNAQQQKKLLQYEYRP